MCTAKNSWWWTEELSETCTVLFPSYLTPRCHLHLLPRHSCTLRVFHFESSLSNTSNVIKNHVLYMTPLSLVLRRQWFSRRRLPPSSGCQKIVSYALKCREHDLPTRWYWIAQCHNSDDHGANIQSNSLSRLLLKPNTVSNRSINWYEHYWKLDNQSTWSKSSPYVTFLRNLSNNNWPGIKPGPSGEKSMIHYLSHRTAWENILSNWLWIRKTN